MEEKELSYDGVPVAITTNGYFTAQVGDSIITEETYSKLKQRIDATKKSMVCSRTVSLKCVAPGRPDTKSPFALETLTVTGINRTSRNVRFAEKTESSKYPFIVSDTVEHRKMVCRWIELTNALEPVNAALHDKDLDSGFGYGRVNPEEYNDLVDQLLKKWNTH